MKDEQFDVVIVGGGFSGTMLAVHLLRRAPELSVAVVDKGAVPARGVAYSTKYLCHLLNVAAGAMTALPEEPNHFLDWARSNAADVFPDHQNLDAATRLASIQSTSFLPRLVYGRYIGAVLEEALARERTGSFRWIEDEVSSVAPEQSPKSDAADASGSDGGITVQLKNGSRLRARAIALATGNFPPANLNIPGLTASSPHYFRSPWLGTALSDIPKNGSVLLIGSGLTSVDIAVALKSEGFAGHIHILSRRGLIPQTHRLTGQWPAFWDERSPRTMLGVLRLVRQQVRSATEAGGDWRDVVNALRPVTQKIWQSLPSNERRRFLRHVRAYWEVHRHRVAPEIGETIANLVRDRQVTLYAARLTNYREYPDYAEVSIRERKTRAEHVLRVDRVINCTGPENDCRRIDDPLMKSLLAQGLVRPDALSLGLDVGADGALLDSQGAPSSWLYAIGPARKGSLWETIAVPELRVQASDLAAHLAGTLKPSIG